jgi:hypothetical protein
LLDVLVCRLRKMAGNFVIQVALHLLAPNEGFQPSQEIRKVVTRRSPRSDCR